MARAPTPGPWPPDEPAGAVETVDLWVAIPEALPPDQLALAEDLMNAEERTRQRAFVFERHRREYLVTRGLVRTVLSRYGALAPAAWQFRRNAYGRPELDPPCGLRFNLANHPSLIVCAVRRGELDLGCDVEPLTRGAEVLGVAASVFAPAELRELHALTTLQQPDRALALWTLKEAYIKARGMGLSLPLQEFAFSFFEDSLSRPSGISFTDVIQDDPARWRFTRFDLLGHRVALALEGAARPPKLRVRQLLGFADEATVIDLAPDDR